jgi:hypothetical protein
VSKGQDGHWEPPQKDWIYAVREQESGLRENRTLVLCFDGTGDSFDNDNSNVVQLVSMLRKDNPAKVRLFASACPVVCILTLRGRM